MKGFFYFPPNWSYSRPDLYIPSLLPYLRDFDIAVCDLNIQYRIYQRGRENLDKCRERINGSMPEPLSEKYDMLYHFLVDNKVRVEYILHDIEHFVDPKEYMLTSLYERELQIFQKTAYKKDISIDLRTKIADVIDILDDEEENYYHAFYKQYFQEHCLDDVEIVLVFPAGIQQLVSTFTLCRYIKKNHPAIKMIVGGDPFTELVNEIDQSWSVLFEKVFDYIVVYGAEYVLPHLLRCIVGGEKADSVPDCIRLQKGMVVKNAKDMRVMDIQNSYLPDFSGYSLESYSVPEIILPYSVARSGYGVAGIISDLRLYQDKYHAAYVHFTDESIPPDVIKQICHAIIEKQLNIKWFTSIQLSGQYTEGLRALMRQAGAVFISDFDDFHSYFFATFILEKEHLLFWLAKESISIC